MSTSYLKLSADELKELPSDQLWKRNETLMAIKDEVTEDQLLLKAELNSRAALKNFDAMPQAEKDAIIQHIQAGGINMAGKK